MATVTVILHVLPLVVSCECNILHYGIIPMVYDNKACVTDETKPWYSPSANQ